MPRKPASPLKVHPEPRTETQSPSVTESAAVRGLCQALERTTGWSLGLRDNLADRRRRFTLAVSPSIDAPVLHRAEANVLAAAMCDVIDELRQARLALWQREAELAAGVPIAARPGEEQHLAQRLAAVLAGGAQAVGCQAAGLYLLDDATSELKLRAGWGLPHERLLEPARPLKGAVADLEALLGHAVVLEDTSLLTQWRCPEDFPAAVCVPVSSSTNPLGTLWVFADTARDFTPQETNLLEIVAGRLASDLEREMLLSDCLQARRVQKQWFAAAARQQERVPQPQALPEGWQAAGWTSQADGVGGDFFDWTLLADGRLAVVLGDAHGAMLQAGFTSAAAQAAWRSHSAYPHDPPALLGRINQTLWTSSTGDEFSSFFYGLVDVDKSWIECSLAGSAALLLVRQGETEWLTTQALPLGALPESVYESWQRGLEPGDVLVAMSEGIRQARDEGGLRLGEAAIASLVRRSAGSSAAEISKNLRELVEAHCPQRQGLDRTILVLKRRL